MTHNPVILQFKFSNYGDSMLQKMNTLRKQSRFCDVTVHINDLEVPGHRVVFAAGSPFLRDQFFLNDSKEVKISMFQDSEVGKQLLLSCYTGALEFPELELVNYLTVASFLQMGHIVEQCTRALSKFIKPRDALDDERRPKSPEKATELPAEPVAVDVDEEEEEEEDDDEVIMQPRSPPPQPEEENPDGEEDGAITIVKVESIADVSNSKLQNHFPSPVPAASLHSPEPQHSLINSTVDTRMGDIVAQQSQSYSVTTNAAALLSGKTAFGGHLRSSDKGLQWYHQCPKCARVFRQLENYANHLKMHKLFMCLLCGKTFTQKGNLHRHMRVHAGIKPFQCKICGKTFTQKCSLLDHLNLHSGDKPHKCNYCDMVFAHKPVLRKHLKQIHGKNSFDNANERNLQEVTIDFDYSRIQESNTDSNPALTIEEPM